jgi:hypothetical protein
LRVDFRNFYRWGGVIKFPGNILGVGEESNPLKS